MTNLPQQFLDEMKEILGDEFDDFLKSYDEPKTTGLRLNTMKLNKEKLLEIIKPFLKTNYGKYLKSLAEGEIF